jgi:hypothetical protein
VCGRCAWACLCRPDLRRSTGHTLPPTTSDVNISCRSVFRLFRLTGHVRYCALTAEGHPVPLWSAVAGVIGQVRHVSARYAPRTSSGPAWARRRPRASRYQYDFLRQSMIDIGPASSSTLPPASGPSRCAPTIRTLPASAPRRCWRPRLSPPGHRPTTRTYAAGEWAAAGREHCRNERRESHVQ